MGFKVKWAIQQCYYNLYQRAEEGQPHSLLLLMHCRDSIQDRLIPWEYRRSSQVGPCQFVIYLRFLHPDLARVQLIPGIQVLMTENKLRVRGHWQVHQNFLTSLLIQLERKPSIQLVPWNQPWKLRRYTVVLEFLHFFPQSLLGSPLHSQVSQSSHFGSDFRYRPTKYSFPHHLYLE